MKFQILFLLFLSAIVNAQTITVLDTNTQKPIPFATLLLKQGDKIVFGTYANRGGIAAIPTIEFEKVLVSCIGYDDKSFLRDEAINTIYLIPKAIELNEVSLTGVRALRDTLIGEYSEKKRDKQGIGDANSFFAVFFENNIGKDVPIRSLWLKLAMIKYTAALRVHLYSRRDYEQKYDYDKEKQEWHLYSSYIPEDELTEQNIVFYVNPKDDKEVKVDLSVYNIVLPESGAFIGLECLGYFDETGQPYVPQSYKEHVFIETHYALNDNFCRKIKVPDTAWEAFWMNTNKLYLHDIIAMKQFPSPDMFKTPTMGLIVGH